MPAARRPSPRVVVAASAAAVLVLVLMVWPARGAKSEGVWSAAEAQALDFLNADRAAHGIAPLRSDPAMANVARAWSAQMAATRNLAHNYGNKSGVAAVYPNETLWGENVAVDGSVLAAMQALQASPHHEENNLTGRFDVIGIGIVADGLNVWVTEEFLDSGAEKTLATIPLRAAAVAPPAVRAAARPAPVSRSSAPPPSRILAPATDPVVAPSLIEPVVAYDTLPVELRLPDVKPPPLEVDGPADVAPPVIGLDTRTAATSAPVGEVPLWAWLAVALAGLVVASERARRRLRST